MYFLIKISVKSSKNCLKVTFALKNRNRKIDRI